jgi:hypothetical protein
MVVTRPESPEEESRGWTVADLGKPYRDSNGSFPLVENMGDAVEAMEECYGMVWQLARQVVTLAGGDPDDRPQLLAQIEDARQNYTAGYQAGAGEPARW